ncbi:MAG TPA: cytochrome c [Casimicrobiaceae bacterium]|nr:cytochrome c [Casimicrobiaceae bacterium]
MNKQVIPVVAALAVVSAFSAAVYAQSADRSIQYRRAIMNSQGWHMYTVLGRMAKGTIPYDKDVAAKSAKYIDQLIDMPWEGFAPGTERGFPTRAKPEIWQQKAKFDKYAQDAKVETAKFASAAGNGLDAMRTAFTATNRACNNCHDDFQNKELSSN